MNLGYYTVILLAMGAAALTASIQHALVAWRLRDRNATLYALGLFSAALTMLVTIRAYQSTTPEEFKFWYQSHVIVSRPLFFSWAVFILQTGQFKSVWPGRVYLGAESLKLALLLICFDTPFFFQIESLKFTTMPWGEILAEPVGQGTWLQPIQIIVPLISLAVSTLAAVQVVKRGQRVWGWVLGLGSWSAIGAVFFDNMVDVMGWPDFNLVELVIFVPISILGWSATDHLIDAVKNRRLLGLRDEQLRHTQKMRAIGELAAGVAHDINNALGAISMTASLLETKVGSNDEDVKLIKSAGKKAAALSEKLRAIGRDKVMELKPINVHKVLQEALALTRHSLGRETKLEWDLQAERDLVLGDELALQNVFVNLSLNARDAMPQGGTLKVSSQDSAGILNIVFTDSGSGIPPELQKKVFEPFFTTKSEGKGTGLGLATALTTLEAHSGSIKLESEEGQGSRFRLFLPLKA